MAVDHDKGSINITEEKSSVAVDEKLRDLAGEDEIDFGDLLYQKKARLLNAAMQETGMGRYQWYVLYSLSACVFLTQFPFTGNYSWSQVLDTLRKWQFQIVCQAFLIDFMLGIMFGQYVRCRPHASFSVFSFSVDRHWPSSSSGDTWIQIWWSVPFPRLQYWCIGWRGLLGYWSWLVGKKVVSLSFRVLVESSNKFIDQALFQLHSFPSRSFCIGCRGITKLGYSHLALSCTGCWCWR